MSRPVWRTLLVCTAFAVVAVLFAAPSRWLARAQFAAVGFARPQSDEQKQATEAARRARAVRLFPNDVDVQIAAALDRAGAEYSPSGQDVDMLRQASLHALVPHFGSQPALYAALLRYQTMDPDARHRMHIARPEEQLLQSYPLPANTKYTPPDPAVLTAWDADCAAGERLDPTNAFFPMMRSIGLFAAHRDKEAVDAVLRAGTKPVWNDYVQNETEGRLRVADAAKGGEYAMDRISITDAALLPHFAPLRAAARIATVQAMHREQAGNVAEGLALRRALMTVADRMRVQSSSYVGCQVGMAIAATATERPGGTKIVRQDVPDRMTDMQRWKWRDTERTEPFAIYAIRAGHPELAAMARAQSAADEEVHAEYSQAGEDTVFGKLMPHITLWVVDEIVLAVVPWLILLGVTAHFLSRRTAFRGARPLPRSVKWGIAAAIVLGVTGIIGYAAQGSELQFALATGIACAVILGVGVLVLLRRRVTRPALGRFIRTLFGTLTALFVGAAIVYAQAQNIGVLEEFWMMSGIADATPMEIISLAPVLFVSLLFLLFAIWGRIRRVPVNVALVRGLLSTSVPLACILVLVWGGLCLHTLQQERVLNAELDRQTAHEGRYYASLVGEKWPGPAVP